MEAELDDNATEQQEQESEITGAASTSSAAKRKKQKSKLAKKLKQKLQPSSSNAAASTSNTTVSADPDEPVPDQVFQHLKAQVEQEHGAATANKLTPEMISMLLKKAKLDDVARGKAGMGGKNKKCVRMNRCLR